jgi:hypothetical protein
MGKGSSDNYGTPYSLKYITISLGWIVTKGILANRLVDAQSIVDFNIRR